VTVSDWPRSLLLGEDASEKVHYAFWRAGAEDGIDSSVRGYRFSELSAVEHGKVRAVTSRDGHVSGVADEGDARYPLPAVAGRKFVDRQPSDD
jgi:hypothetical protein